MGENIFSKSITVLAFVSTFIAQHTLGQISDSFDDGNFTEAPAWLGTSENFEIALINGSNRLKLKAQIAGSSILRLPFSIPNNHNAEWEMIVSHQFASSGQNNSRVYLISDSENFSGPVNGYYLQFGENGAQDAVELFRQDGNASTSVLRGPNGDIDQANFTVRVRVTRSSVGEWQLFIDPSGANNFNATGTSIDNTYSTGNFFGVRCLYTVTNINGFYFDDFNVSTSLAPDVTPPALTSVTISSPNQIELLFSEPLSGELTITAGDFVLNDTIAALSATFDETNSVISLTFEDGMKNGYMQKISFPNLSDAAANILQAGEKNFLYFDPIEPKPLDIVINEVYPDPSPSFGLPAFEFIEIYNRSNDPFQLSGWQITDGSTTGTLTDHILLPGDYLVLTAQEAGASYLTFGATMPLQHFPSLNNSGDKLILRGPDTALIDSLIYTTSAYRDEDKDAGGYTLERINYNESCSGIDNWKASLHEIGGTPGQANSVMDLTEDQNPPVITEFRLIETDSLVIHFNERLSTEAVNADKFSFNPLSGIDSIAFTDGSNKSISVLLQSELDSLTTYSVTMNSIADCKGNVMISDSTFLIKLDNTAPVIRSVVTVSQTSVRVRFSKKIDVSGLSEKNFFIPDLMLAEIKPIDPYLLQLEYSTRFVNGKEYALMISNVPDLAGNVSDTTTHAVLFFQPFPVAPKDIVISEIFADPTPTIGLPETEYVELFNRSEHPVQLNNWTFHDDRSEVKLKSHILMPQEYLVLTTASKAYQFINSMGVSSFPALTNSGESLMLKDSTGTMIDSVNYSDAWYRDSEKADGGWSLELIDPDNVCAEGENWIGSEDPSGGTPGKLNSVDAEKPDLTAPKIVSVFASASDSVIVAFNEKMNGETPLSNSFSFEPHVGIDHIVFTDESKRACCLKLSSALEAGLRYAISITDVADCAGNVIATHEPISFVLPQPAQPSDIVINEVLFNPSTTGVDFVELYNRSDKFINLKDWHIANMVNDTISNPKVLTQTDVIFEPGDFLVLTIDPNVLKGEYLQSVEEKILKTQLPPLSDDEGSVAIIDAERQIIDTLFYSDKQHSPFLKNTEGVSLERVDTNSPSSNKNNWQSASATSGYATPGFRNGSAMQQVFEEAIHVQPEIFAPMSGQDFTMIGYRLDRPGYVANVRIVNAHGRVVKEVAKNELVGVEGFFTWHGETTAGSKAAIGAYMVWFEAFDQNGNVITIKKRVVIAEGF